MNIWTRIGGRKLLAFLFGLGALMFLSCTDKLSDSAVWGILALTAVFTGGNIGEHLTAVVKSRFQTKGDPHES